MNYRRGSYGMAGLTLACALATSPACTRGDITVATAHAQSRQESHDIPLEINPIAYKAKIIFDNVLAGRSCEGITIRPSEIRDPSVKSKHSSTIMRNFEYNISAMRTQYFSDGPKDKMQITVNINWNGEKKTGEGNVYFLDEPLDGRLDATEFPDDWFISNVYGAKLLKYLGISDEVPRASLQYNSMMERAFSGILDDLIAKYKCEPPIITAQARQIR